jgi:hypothetical protein
VSNHVLDGAVYFNGPAPTREPSVCPLLDHQRTLHVLMPQAAELRTLERESSGLVSNEFHGNRLSLWELLIDAEGFDLNSVIAVLRRDHQRDPIALSDGYDVGRKVVLFRRYPDLAG